jgi:hypothetical protein
MVGDENPVRAMAGTARVGNRNVNKPVIQLRRPPEARPDWNPELNSASARNRIGHARRITDRTAG